MRKTKISLFLFVLAIMFASVCKINAQLPTENMANFFDSITLGLNIQVNATAQTQPTQNVTALMSLTAESGYTISVTNFNFSISGFENGTNKVLMANITENSSFTLNAGESKQYNCNFTVPETVWDTTYGEIVITYFTTYGPYSTKLENLTLGFTMTNVENVYLKGIETKLANLNSTFYNLFQMNLTEENLAALNKTYRELQGSVGDLDNTRRAVAVLAITTVFFVATTAYMVFRKPKEYW